MIQFAQFIKPSFLPNNQSWAYIYHLIDPISNQIRYVGQSKDPQKRYKQHIQEAKSIKYGHLYKNRWLKKLLQNNQKPIMSVIAVTLIDLVDLAEVIEIAKYENLTNATRGGKGHTKSMSEESKSKISNTLKGKKPKNFEDFLAAGHNASRTSKQLQNGFKKGMIPWNKGHNCTVEHRALQSSIQNHRKIKIIDQHGNIYDSISDAAKKVNTQKHCIKKVLEGKYTHTKGYKFKKL